jgi:tubby-related protein 1
LLHTNYFFHHSDQDRKKKNRKSKKQSSKDSKKSSSRSHQNKREEEDQQLQLQDIGGVEEEKDDDISIVPLVPVRDQQEEKVLPLNVPHSLPVFSDLRKFLTSPVSKSFGMVQCYVKRSSSASNMFYPKYSIYLKEGDQFLMSSRKRPNNKTSNYLISMGKFCLDFFCCIVVVINYLVFFSTIDQNDLNRNGTNYLGKLRSNFLGTEYQIFDDGVNPKDADADDKENRSKLSLFILIGIYFIF